MHPAHPSSASGQPLTRQSVTSLAKYLHDALVASERPPSPPSFHLPPQNLDFFVRHVLENSEWNSDITVCMNLISLILVPDVWPQNNLQAFRDAIGDASRSGVCGRVWKENELAYKCKTCERDPTCVVCVPCFRKGSHQGHDYAMVRTGGGCCDCGDVQAWKKEGFCSMHRGASAENEDPTTSLCPLLLQRSLAIVRVVATYVGTLCGSLHVSMGERRSIRRSSIQRAISLLTWLGNIVRCGDGMRRAIGEFLTSQVSGKMLIRSFCDADLIAYLGLKPSQSNTANISWLSLMLRMDGIERLPYEVQSNLHTVYFQLITDLVFKRRFLETFVQNYELYIHAQVARDVKTSPFLTQGSIWDNEEKARKSDLVDSFTVQLFTVPALVPVMIRKGGLLDILINLLQNLFETFSNPVECYENEIPLAESAYAQSYPAQNQSAANRARAEGTAAVPSLLQDEENRRPSLPISALLQERVKVSLSANDGQSSRNTDESGFEGEAFSGRIPQARDLDQSDSSDQTMDPHRRREAVEGPAAQHEATVDDTHGLTSAEEGIAPQAVAGGLGTEPENHVEASDSEDEDADMLDVEREDEIVLEVTHHALENVFVDDEMADRLAQDFIDDDHVLTGDFAPSENSGDGSDYIFIGSEEEGRPPPALLRRVSAFEGGLQRTPHNRFRLVRQEPSQSRYTSAIAEARGMAPAAAEGTGLIAHPMRLDLGGQDQPSANVLYWRVLIDLRYVLCHPAVAFHLIHERKDLFRILVRTFSMAQGMCPSARRFGDHVSIEGNTWGEAFKIEMEIYHLIALVAEALCMNEIPKREYVVESDNDATLRAFDPKSSRLQCLFDVKRCLDEWLDREAALEALSTYSGESFCVTHSVSIHLPLHRFLALLTHHAIRLDGLDVSLALAGRSSVNDGEESGRFLTHPLRLQVFLAQVRAGMWRRNGRPVYSQATLYRLISCSEWFVDLDIFLQQCCAVSLGPEVFTKQVLAAFRIFDLDRFIALSYSTGDEIGGVGFDDDHRLLTPSESNERLNDIGLLPIAPRHLTKKSVLGSECIPEIGNSVSEIGKFAPAIAEELMLYLARVCCERVKCGLTLAQFLKRKLIHVLCYRDRTHSEMLRACSFCIDTENGNSDSSGDRNSSHALLETILKEISTFIPPHGIEPGRYRLRDDMWSEFDFFTPYLTPRERCAAEVKYIGVCKKNHVRPMAIPDDIVSERGLYSQMSGLFDLIVALCGTDGNSLATIALRENVTKNKGDRSVESTLAAAIFLICSAVEAAPCAPISNHTRLWWREFSAHEKISSSFFRGIVDIMRGSEGDTTAYTDLQPAAERVFRASYKAANTELQRRLAQFAPHLVKALSPSSDKETHGAEHNNSSVADEARKAQLRVKKKEQQKAAMERMKLAQADFAKQILNIERSGESEQDGTTDIQPQLTDDQPNVVASQSDLSATMLQKDQQLAADMQNAMDAAIDPREVEECALCHEDKDSASDKLIGLVGFYQWTTIPYRAQALCRKANTQSCETATSSQSVEHDETKSESGKRQNRNSSTKRDGVLFVNNGENQDGTSETRPKFDPKGLLACIEEARNVHLSFCGHSLHVTCFESYYSTLVRSRLSDSIHEGSNIVDLDKSEFLCPVCRRLANIVLPLTIAKSRNQEERSTVLQEQRRDSSYEHWLKRSNLEMRIGWSRNVCEKCVDPALSESGRGAELADAKREVIGSVSALRASLTLRGRMMLRGIGLLPPTAGSGQAGAAQDGNDGLSEDQCFFERLSSSVISSAVCAEIAARSRNWQDSEFQQYSRSLKHILRECRAQGALYEPSEDRQLLWELTERTGAQATFDSFAWFVYLCVVWSDPFTLFEVKRLACLGLRSVFRRGEHSLKTESMSADAIGLGALLYLRRAAVVISSVFDIREKASLDVYQEMTDGIDKPTWTREVRLLMDLIGMPSSLIPAWFDAMLAKPPADISDAVFRPGRVGLMKLPEIYQSLLEDFEGKVCTKCAQVPKQPFLCLICESLICNRSVTRTGDGSCIAGTIAHHTKTCGGRTGVLLNLRDTRLLIVREDGISRWGSLYLDVHGEEDPSLSRGKPLFLNEGRYADVEKMWLFLAFHHDSRILRSTQPLQPP